MSEINESINTSPSSTSKAEYDDEELSYQKNYYYKYKEKNFGNLFYNNYNNCDYEDDLNYKRKNSSPLYDYYNGFEKYFEKEKKINYFENSHNFIEKTVYYSNPINFTESVKDIKQIFKTSVTKYWETHYIFGSSSETNTKILSPFSLNLLMINTAIPMLFAYGRYKGYDKLCDRAFDFLEELKAENNYIVRMWKSVGLNVENAGDSQALIQLKNEYCDKKECLRCRIGYEYLKTRHDKLE